jgi:hypothetical protein
MTPPPKLSDLQIELLKMFSIPLEESQVLEIKQILADYFAKNVDRKVDDLFEKNNWTSAKVEEWLGEHMRTPYVGK